LGHDIAGLDLGPRGTVHPKQAAERAVGQLLK
jgi:hypothetical protein